MLNYVIEDAVFEMFPAFRRGVVVAVGIDNQGSALATAGVLAEAISTVTASAQTEERISVWNEAYKRFGADPDRHTPSIRFLYEQIRRGKPPRSINKCVDLFNTTSLKWAAPCGGDDLAALNGGSLRLGLAHGDETFAPLFKPNSVERPEHGEVIYFTPQTKRVLCRRWTWRNSDFSKLRPETSAVAINVDMMMPPFTEDDLASALRDLAASVGQFCGGTVQTFVLGPNCPSFEVSI